MATLSSGTATDICIICSGVTSLEPAPHPIYTNGGADVVVQLNMITLGGPNGLNN